jgi:hypothetical protein
MATKFKDLFKKFSDLVGKEFPTAEGDLFAVDVETKLSSEDVTVTTNMKRGADGKFQGQLKPEIKVNDVTVTGTFSTKQTHQVDLKYKKDTAEVTVTGVSGSDNVDVRATFDYVDTKFSVGAGLSYPYAGKNAITGAANVTFVYENLTVGLSGAAEYDEEKTLGPNEAGIGLVYAENDYTLGFVATRKVNEAKNEENAKLGFSYYQKVDETTNAGVGFSVDTAKETKAVVAYEKTLDNLSSLKSRLQIQNTNQLNAGFVYAQKIDNMKVTFGTDLSVSALLGGEGNHKFNVKLNLLD